MTRRNVSGPRSPGPRHAYLVHVGQDEPGRREGGGSHADIGQHRDDGDGYVNGEHSIQPWRALVPRPKHASITWLDPTAGLADGDVDAALLRLPFPGQDTLRTMVLFTEARRVALPAAHPPPTPTPWSRTSSAAAGTMGRRHDRRAGPASRRGPVSA